MRIYIDIDGTIRATAEHAGITPTRWDDKNNKGQTIIDFYKDNEKELINCQPTKYFDTIMSFIKTPELADKKMFYFLSASTDSKWQNATREWITKYFPDAPPIIFTNGREDKITYIKEDDLIIDDWPADNILGNTILIATAYNLDIQGKTKYTVNTPNELAAILKKDVLDMIYRPLGMKFDTGKLNWNLMPFSALEDTVKVLMYGAKKYAPDNWKHVTGAHDRYYAAALRHLFAWKEGEKNDKETGISHLAHALCCILFLSFFEKHGNEHE